DWVSYRLYTIWAVLEILVLGVLVGSLLDTWQSITGRPIRAFGLGLAVVLLLIARVPFREPLEDAEATPNPHADHSPDDWPDLFLARLRAVPEGKPVVLVACSGGGSRAAIFSALVLEGLAREPFPDAVQPAQGHTWADHVVLISSVSGGSLGTA